MALEILDSVILHVPKISKQAVKEHKDVATTMAKLSKETEKGYNWALLLIF